MSITLSIVIPAYNEELMVGRCARRLRDVMEQSGISYELIFVSDGSSDNTWKEIKKARTADPHVRGLRFSNLEGLTPGFRAY